MTRISSLIVATTMAILPISAFAQQTVAPAKDAAPTTTAPVAAPVGGKTAKSTTAHVTAPVKSGVKPDVHGMNTAAPHNTGTTVPAKTAEPSKS